MTIKVKVGEGREVPLHPSDYAGPGGGVTTLTASDGAVEVTDSPGIRRRLRAGDLVIVADEAKKAGPK